MNHATLLNISELKRPHVVQMTTRELHPYSLQMVGDHSLTGAGLGGAAGYSVWMEDDIAMGD